jgi:hypothetical protein
VVADERGAPFDDDQPPGDGRATTPFDSIEGAYEYVGLLAAAIAEAEASIQEDLALAREESASRRADALRVVAFKLQKLRLHITSSRRILNDLRSLRRLLLSERRMGR